MGCSDNGTRNCTLVLPSNCITYQGEDVPILGLCKGDSMTVIMEAVIEELTTIASGTGTILSDISPNCDFINNQLAGKNKSLFNLIQILIDSSCTLKGLIDAIETEIGSSVTYETKCITPTGAGTQGTVQGIINLLCELSLTVSNITDGLGENTLAETINTLAGNTLLNNVQSTYGVTKSGSGSSASLSFYGFVPPFCPVFCLAPLSYWNQDGTGKSGTPFEGWFICNGFAADDMRGFVPMGATFIPGINSPALNTIVDPTVNADITYGTNIGDIVGEVKHVLTVTELPTHSHNFANSSHSHSIPATPINIGDITPPSLIYGLTDSGSVNRPTSSTVIGDDSSTVGSNFAHENRQASKCGYFIMRKI